MTINGEPCAELDFSAMHPTLAYNIAGVQMDGDPYDLGDAFERRQVKLGLLIVMNARDPASAARALAQHGRQLGINHDKAKAIVNAKRRHQGYALQRLGHQVDERRREHHGAGDECSGRPRNPLHRHPRQHRCAVPFRGPGACRNGEILGSKLKRSKSL
jgi:hypothetical protein